MKPINFKTHFIKEWTIQSIRDFFIQDDFHEVETPTLLPSLPLEPGLFSLKTTWKERNIDFYLPASPESSIKKLITLGIGNCFTVTKAFRDLEDIGPTHNLEFTILEWYEMGKDYNDIAKTTQNLIINSFHRILEKQNKRKTNILNYQGKVIDLTPPWHRFTLLEAFQKFAKMDLSKNLDIESIVATAKLKGYNTDGVSTWEPLFDQILINEIEPNLPQDKPVFLCDYPTSLSPFCKLCPDNPGFSQRFELYIGGMEISNAYSELTDSKMLEESFKKETDFRKTNNLPYHPYDQKLIEATINFPDCAGIALGVDRLAMLFADTNRIEDVIYFPISSLI